MKIFGCFRVELSPWRYKIWLQLLLTVIGFALHSGKAHEIFTLFNLNRYLLYYADISDSSARCSGYWPRLLFFLLY